MQPFGQIERDIIWLEPGSKSAAVVRPALPLGEPAPDRDAIFLTADHLETYHYKADQEREAVMNQLQAAEAELEQALAAIAGQGADVDNDRASHDLAARLSDIRAMQKQAQNAPLTALSALAQSLPQIIASTSSGVSQAVQSSAMEKHTLMAEITVEAMQGFSIRQIGTLTADHFALMDDAQLAVLRGRIIEHSGSIADRASDNIDARVDAMRANGQDPDALLRLKQQWQRDLQAANARGDAVAAADAAHNLAIAGGDPQDIADARTLATTARIERFRSENPHATKEQIELFEKEAAAEVSAKEDKTTDIVAASTSDRQTQHAVQKNALEREENRQMDAVDTTEIRAFADSRDAQNVEWGGSLSLGSMDEFSIEEVGQLSSPKLPAKPVETVAKGQGGSAPLRS